jgi:hypothetical protein
MLQRVSEREREAQRAAFLRLAGEKFDRMFDRKDETVQRTFTELEDRACDGGDELSRFLMVSRLGSEVSAGPVEVYPCPDCGRPTTGREGEALAERTVVTRRGSVPIARPERACPACRRALFPPRP